MRSAFFHNFIFPSHLLSWKIHPNCGLRNTLRGRLLLIIPGSLAAALGWGWPACLHPDYLCSPPPQVEMLPVLFVLPIRGPCDRVTDTQKYHRVLSDFLFYFSLIKTFTFSEKFKVHNQTCFLVWDPPLSSKSMGLDLRLTFKTPLPVWAAFGSFSDSFEAGISVSYGCVWVDSQQLRNMLANGIMDPFPLWMLCFSSVNNYAEEGRELSGYHSRSWNQTKGVQIPILTLDTFLSFALSFLIYKMGIITISTTWNCCENWMDE